MFVGQIIITGISPEIIIFIFLWLGAFTRTIFPYLREWEQNPDLIFQKKYLVSFVIAGITATLASAQAFGTYTFPQSSFVELAIASFIAGWGLTDFLNRTMTGTGTQTYKIKDKQKES